jgi:hypothetical protein
MYLFSNSIVVVVVAWLLLVIGILLCRDLIVVPLSILILGHFFIAEPSATANSNATQDRQKDKDYHSSNNPNYHPCGKLFQSAAENSLVMFSVTIFKASICMSNGGF